MTTTLRPEAAPTAPAAFSPLTAKPLFGVHAPLDPATTVREFPGVNCTRVFVEGVQTSPRSLLTKVERICGPSWSAGLTPVYSFKLDPGQVAARRWDPFLRELADWHKDPKRPAQIVLWHEPEGAFTDGREFGRYFNYLAGVIRGVNTQLPLIYSAMGYHWAEKWNPRRDLGRRVAPTSVRGATDVPAAWRVEADLLCCDVYSGRSFPLDRSLATHAGFTRWREQYVEDQPYGITERGFTITATKNPPTESRETREHTRVAALKEELDWLTGNADGGRCQLYVFWATPGKEKDRGFLLNDEGSRNAVRKVIQGLAHR